MMAACVMRDPELSAEERARLLERVRPLRFGFARRRRKRSARAWFAAMRAAVEGGCDAGA